MSLVVLCPKGYVLYMASRCLRNYEARGMSSNTTARFLIQIGLNDSVTIGFFDGSHDIGNQDKGRRLPRDRIYAP